METIRIPPLEALRFHLYSQAKARGDDEDKAEKFSMSVVGNIGQAVSWYRTAAEQGDPWAQYNLGVIYNEGEGVPRDYLQAAIWYRKAADKANAEAESALGFLYEHGDGVAQDDTLAVSWFRKAAEMGEVPAEYALASAYSAGTGVAQDDAKAAFWFRNAAERGNLKAQHELGDIYNNGRGIPKNHIDAAFWFRKAAEQGDAGAQYALAIMYFTGEGVPQDYTLAEAWCAEAAKNGNDAALFSLREAQNALAATDDGRRDQYRLMFVAIAAVGALATIVFMLIRFRSRLSNYIRKFIPRTSRARQLAVLLPVASWCSGCCLYQALTPRLMHHPINAAVTVLLLSAPVVILGALSLWWLSQVEKSP